MATGERQDIPLRKVVIVGSGAVGKTTLATRLITGEFVETQMTVGLNVEAWTVEDRENNASIKIVSFDLGGQNQFRFFQQEFVKGANFALVVFDITRYESFMELDEWLSFINPISKECILIVANKIDLPAVVSEEDIKEYATKNQLKVIFTSTATGEGIDEVERIIWESLKGGGQCTNS